MIVLPLALAQFIASFAASNMNVAIESISHDLGTNVIGVQTAITLFTLTMAASMITGSKLTDIWGRKFCLIVGLVIYGLGALIAAIAPVLPVLIAGYSVLEGIGSALMIPPLYILVTVLFTNVTDRAKNFGILSGAGGIGAAAGPLIGGLITSTVSWRASFVVQSAVVAAIIVLTLRLPDTPLARRVAFDAGGAILSALGLVFLVVGVLQSGTYGWIRAREDFTVAGNVLIPVGGISPVWLFVIIGVAFLLWFYRHLRTLEQAGRAGLISLSVLKNRVSNLALATQNAQWLIMQGSFFVVSVFLQTIRGFNAVQTGLALTPATIGVLLSSGVAGRLAKRFQQTSLIQWGFVATIAGLGLLILLARVDSSILSFVPGLLIIGLGVGVMLTSSVNVVQSSFTDQQQGEISGLSRSISNLGSSLGTALAGSVLVSSLVQGDAQFLLALLVMLVIAIIGLMVALRLPRRKTVPVTVLP